MDARGAVPEGELHVTEVHHGRIARVVVVEHGMGHSRGDGCAAVPARAGAPHIGAMPRLHHPGALAALLLALAMIVSPAAPAEPFRVVAFGDSLTAGYGLPASAAFPAVLERELRARGWDVSVANAGVSGDTTAGGLARLEWSVPASAKAVIVELGANDALRGLDPRATAKALEDIVARLLKRGQPVFLAGMSAPRNLGARYTEAFDGIFPDLARRYDAPLYPFFLDGVLGQPGMTLPDGLHPTAKGVERIVQGVLPAFEAFLGKLKAPRLAG